MESTNLVRTAGWCAYVSAAATIVGFVTLLLFFSVGEPFGTVNDVTSIVIALSMIPIALFLFQLTRTKAPTIALIALVLGALSMLAAAVLQAMLVLRLVSPQLTLTAVPTAFAFIGIWLLLSSLLTRSMPGFPTLLASLGIIAGVAYVVVIAGFIIGGQQHPLAAIGGLTAVISYPIWAVWLGRLLLSGQLAL